MRLPLLAVLLVGILAGAAPRSVAAQDCSSATRRPRLDSSRDTNNAGAYYYYGLSQLPKYPKRAAEAFCWAERLDPSWALPLYGRWTALLLNQPSWRLLAYLGGDESVVHSPEILRIDSLKYRALLRDPLLYERLDELLYREVIANLTAGELTLYDIGGSSAQGRAWMAYGRGDFALALSEYARAIHAKPDNFALHGARARVFYLTLQFDSSRVEFETMLAGFRNRRKDKIVYVYQSEALTLFAIGKTYEAEGNLDSARAAYGQALVEDLSFYSAHAAYGRLAFAREAPPRPPTNTGWQWSWRGTMPRSDTGTGWCSLPRGLALKPPSNSARRSPLRRTVRTPTSHWRICRIRAASTGRQ